MNTSGSQAVNSSLSNNIENSTKINRFPYAIFLVIFFVDFLQLRLHMLPKIAILLPEILSVFSLLIVLMYIVRFGVLRVSVKYIILFFFFILVMISGYILNSVDVGPIISGLRNYLKYVPFFLLPAVINYTDEQIAKQIKFLLILALIQIPLVIVQKFVLQIDMDHVAGTLNIGSILSLFLLGVIALVFGFYLKNKLKLGISLFFIVLFFFPTMLNETKSIIIFLPIVIVTSLVVSSRGQVNKGRLFAVFALGVVMLVVFIASYKIFFGDQFADEEGGENKFLSNPSVAIQHYLFSDILQNIDPKKVLNLDKRVVGEISEISFGEDRVARLDSIFLPMVVLSQDVSKLALGLGAGNASKSFIPIFSGKYKEFAGLNISMPALAIFLWEIGIIGALIFLIFFIFIFNDCIFMSKQPGLISAIAVGWAGVVVMIILSLTYKPFMTFSVLGVLFWYFSGLLSARRWIIFHESREEIFGKNSNFNEHSNSD